MNGHGHDGHRHGEWSRWKARLYAVRHRNPASNRAVVEWADLEPGMRVLDVGCGPGAALIAAAPFLATGEAVGVDPSTDLVRIARRRTRGLSNTSIEVAAAEDLPFPANAFDIVWSVHSSHHWNDVAVGIREALRVLRPGGRFLIVERNDPSRPWGITIDQARTLADALTAAGFVDVGVEERPVGRACEFLVRGSSPQS